MIYALIMTFSNCGVNFLNFYNLRKYIFFQKRYRYNITQHIKPIFTLFGMSFSLNLYLLFPISIIGLLLNNQSVGLYSSAHRIMSMALMLVTSIGTVLLPRISFLYAQKDCEKIILYLERSLCFIFMSAMWKKLT